MTDKLYRVDPYLRSFDAGVRIESLRACWPLRMRVSMSPRGSVIAISATLTSST